MYVSVLGNLTGIAYCEEGENTVYVYILCNGLEDRRKKRGGGCVCVRGRGATDVYKEKTHNIEGGGVYWSEVAERLMCGREKHTI